MAEGEVMELPLQKGGLSEGSEDVLELRRVFQKAFSNQLQTQKCFEFGSPIGRNCREGLWFWVYGLWLINRVDLGSPLSINQSWTFLC